MKVYKTSQTPAFFDVELRVQWLLAKGNPLRRLATVIDWERFRPVVEAVWDQPAKGPGGPRPNGQGIALDGAQRSSDAMRG